MECTFQVSKKPHFSPPPDLFQTTLQFNFTTVMNVNCNKTIACQFQNVVCFCCALKNTEDIYEKSSDSLSINSGSFWLRLCVYCYIIAEKFKYFKEINNDFYLYAIYTSFIQFMPI